MTLPNTSANLEERKNAKIAHKLEIFLRDQAYWVESTPTTSKRPRILPYPVIDEPLPQAPETVIKYGKKSFDTARKNPLLLNRQLKTASAKKRLFRFINFSNIL